MTCIKIEMWYAYELLIKKFERPTTATTDFFTKCERTLVNLYSAKSMINCAVPEELIKDFRETSMTGKIKTIFPIFFDKKMGIFL